MQDTYDLERFVDAQDPVFAEVLSELRQGRKRSHWMWFVFPQLKGLGRSQTADYYGISSIAEAEAYWRHDVLGPRLRECTEIVNAVDGRSAEQIFGWPDHLKFRSSMTLFSRAAPDVEIFTTAIEKYFGGKADPLTLGRL